MVHIEYAGLAPETVEFINSQEFLSVLETHPSLRLVTVEEDEDGDEVFTHVPIPLQEGHYDCVGAVDKDDKDAFMWILYDDFASVTSPSPAFIAVLRTMDDFSTSTLEERLFISPNQDLYVDSPEVLAAEYDFTQGDYVL